MTVTEEQPRRRNHTVAMPIDDWRLLLNVLQGTTWIHAPFQYAVSSLQVQLSHYRDELDA